MKGIILVAILVIIIASVGYANYRKTHVREAHYFAYVLSVVNDTTVVVEFLGQNHKHDEIMGYLKIPGHKLMVLRGGNKIVNKHEIRLVSIAETKDHEWEDSFRIGFSPRFKLKQGDTIAIDFDIRREL